MIVARGLGRGPGAILVTAGLGLGAAVIVVPPALGGGGFGHVPRRFLVPPSNRRLNEEAILLVIMASLEVLDFR